jgi:hypothetical protein
MKTSETVSRAAAQKRKLRAEKEIIRLTILLAEAKRQLHEATILLEQAKRAAAPSVVITHPRFASSVYACSRPNPRILETFWPQAKEIVELLTPESEPEAVYTGQQIIEHLTSVMGTDQSVVDAFQQMRSRFLYPYILKVPAVVMKQYVKVKEKKKKVMGAGRG